MRLGDMVCEAISNSIKALKERNLDLADQIVAERALGPFSSGAAVFSSALSLCPLPPKVVTSRPAGWDPRTHVRRR